MTSNFNDITIYFLLCAFNEEKNIAQQIDTIRRNFNNKKYKIVIVDDGSTDNTRKEIDKSNSYKDIILIEHPKNLGLGVAIKTGLLYLLNKINNDDVVITMDADNTHPVSQAFDMIRKIYEGYEMVIGSRYQPGAKQIKVPFVRKLLSFSARYILRYIFYHKNIKDYTSGYRAYKGSLIKKLINKYGENFITEKNFVVQLEILTKILTFTNKICEIPIVLEYAKKYSKSKLKIVKNVFSYLRFIFYYICKKGEKCERYSL